MACAKDLDTSVTNWQTFTVWRHDDSTDLVTIENFEGGFHHRCACFSNGKNKDTTEPGKGNCKVFGSELAIFHLDKR